MKPEDLFDDSFSDVPFMAILRGIQPEEVLGVAASLVENGIKAIEIPINSPEPFRSIELLSNEFGANSLIGCGTALSTDDVQRAIDAGASLVVHPHANPELVNLSVSHKKVVVPGVMTPTEAFSMLASGATALKLFPSEMMSPTSVAALKAVLPEDTRLVSVGGIGTANISAYWEVGVRAFGLGSTIYKPGMSPAEVSDAVRPLIELGRSLREIPEKVMVS